MVSLNTGRVCLKVMGREAGRYCVILKKIDKAFVLVTGPKLLTGVKRRRANLDHLEPTQYKLEIKEDASDEEVIQAYEKAGLITKFKLKKPSAADLKAKKAKEGKQKKPKKEKSEKKPKKEKEKTKS